MIVTLEKLNIPVAPVKNKLSQCQRIATQYHGHGPLSTQEQWDQEGRPPYLIESGRVRPLEREPHVVVRRLLLGEDTSSLVRAHKEDRGAVGQLIQLLEDNTPDHPGAVVSCCTELRRLLLMRERIKIDQDGIYSHVLLEGSSHIWRPLPDDVEE